jgi:flagellar biosynthesis/type III secretory pathway protein FliH
VQTHTVHLSKPITSVKVLGSESAVCDTSQNTAAGMDLQASAGGQHSAGASQSAQAAQLKSQGLDGQQTELSQVCCTLKGVVDKLNQFHNETLAEAKGEIAKLSVEIARKILVQKVQEGDYEIESIIKEALPTAPTHQDVVVHLNPEDLAQCEKALQDDSSGALTGIKLVPDPNIGRAECMLETPKGMVESLIEEHLEQIGKALTKTE